MYKMRNNHHRFPLFCCRVLCVWLVMVLLSLSLQVHAHPFHTPTPTSSSQPTSTSDGSSVRGFWGCLADKSNIPLIGSIGSISSGSFWLFLSHLKDAANQALSQAKADAAQAKSLHDELSAASQQAKAVEEAARTQHITSEGYQQKKSQIDSLFAQVQKIQDELGTIIPTDRAVASSEVAESPERIAAKQKMEEFSAAADRWQQAHAELESETSQALVEQTEAVKQAAAEAAQALEKLENAESVVTKAEKTFVWLARAKWGTTLLLGISLTMIAVPAILCVTDGNQSAEAPDTSSLLADNELFLSDCVDPMQPCFLPSETVQAALPTNSTEPGQDAVPFDTEAS